MQKAGVASPDSVGSSGGLGQGLKGMEGLERATPERSVLGNSTPRDLALNEIDCLGYRTPNLLRSRLRPPTRPSFRLLRDRSLSQRVLPLLAFNLEECLSRVATPARSTIPLRPSATPTLALPLNLLQATRLWLPEPAVPRLGVGLTQAAPRLLVV